MTRTRFTLLVIAALAAVCGAFYMSSQRNLRRDTLGAPLFPSLGAELDTVTGVSILKGSAAPSVTLHETGGRWTVAQRADYPADAAKLRRLLLALGDARVVEEKTANPANYAIIGVEDPTKPGASGAEIEVIARNGKHAVIVGKPIGDGTFARRIGESRSCTVEPALSVDADPRAWIDTRLIDIPSSSIQSVDFKPAAGAGYRLFRIKPKEGDFALDHVPAGRKALDGKALAPPASTLSGLNIEDVAGAKDVDFGESSQAVFTLEDGNVITLEGAAAGDKRWIEVRSSKDAALAGKTQGRAFEVASYRYDAIFRPLDQLLVPKESKAPAKPDASSKPGASTRGASANHSGGAPPRISPVPPGS